MTAFDQGFKAYKEGWSHQENPYPEDSDKGSEWQIGWNQANYQSCNID